MPQPKADKQSVNVLANANFDRRIPRVRRFFVDAPDSLFETRPRQFRLEIGAAGSPISGLRCRSATRIKAAVRSHRDVEWKKLFFGQRWKTRGLDSGTYCPSARVSVAVDSDWTPASMPQLIWETGFSASCLAILRRAICTGASGTMKRKTKCRHPIRI